jgi:GR25 family glycosyltransferase involved in LPS biosynthesis
MIPVYIIHYTPLRHRLPNIQSVAQAIGNSTLITEFDKGNITSEELSTYYRPNEESFNRKVSSLWDSSQHKFRILNDGEISCTIKHIFALQRIANSSSEFAIVLEDDAIPTSNNILSEINEILDHTPNDWDAIFLGIGCGQGFFNHKIINSEWRNDKVAKINHPASNCTEAYLITKKFANKILSTIIPFDLVIDWEFSYQFYNLGANIYWPLSPLFIQGSKNGSYNSAIR